MTTKKWRCQNSKGEYLNNNTKWSADYCGKASVTTHVPILEGAKTVALSVNVDSHWNDDTAAENAKFIVRACNNHSELVDMLKSYLDCGYGSGIEISKEQFKEAKALLNKIAN